MNQIEFTQQERKSGVQEVLNEILHQIHQQPIQFKFAGFFVINTGFLTTIAAGVVTYLIVLIQFYKD
jgi:7tm Chemosensory receptor